MEPANTKALRVNLAARGAIAELKVIHVRGPGQYRGDSLPAEHEDTKRRLSELAQCREMWLLYTWQLINTKAPQSNRRSS